MGKRRPEVQDLFDQVPQSPKPSLPELREKANAAVRALRQASIDAGDTKELVRFGRECLVLGSRSIALALGEPAAAEEAYQTADACVSRAAEAKRS